MFSPRFSSASSTALPKACWPWTTMRMASLRRHLGLRRLAGRAGGLDLGDLGRRELQHLRQDLMGVLAQERRALHLGDAVGKLYRIADGEVLAARRMVDLD